MLRDRRLEVLDVVLEGDLLLERHTCEVLERARLGGVAGGRELLCLVHVQNLLGRPTAVYVELIGRCELFAGATRTACYRWLGKTLAVLTDGEFARTGWPQLVDEDARRECRAGARRLDEPLVTFS